VTAAVELRDLFRVYSEEGTGVAALQGLTLDVREGEVCVVLGPSGSGKSTLLRILAGLDRPSAGRAFVHGTDVSRLRGRALARYRAETLGYAEQHYRRALAEELTARELIEVQPGLAGVAARERRARADELLERVGLADRAGARPSELSGGEQQRVAVAAALAHRPKLFLADEPTGELDAANATRIYELIGDLVRDAGATAVIVSHDPHSASVADRIVRVRDGRLSEEVARSDDDDTIVVGKGGWLRLSEELLRRAGIASRATARVGETGIVVAPSGPAPGPSAAGATVLRPPELARRPRREVVGALRAVTKSYGDGERQRPVLADLSVAFAPGRLHAVTGPSGSGKTTLLHLLAGIDVPDDGRVFLGETEISRLDRTERARARRELVGLIGQEPGLVSFLSARENVALALGIRAVAGDVDEALEAVGLAERAEGPVHVLSAGERERVAIARALVSRPPIVLADEPTSRLDQANALAVSALFARLAAEMGATVICATHDPLVIEQADETLPLVPAETPAFLHRGSASARSDM
jgi:ABC-type lipoprotein export system ATPase subunit